MIAATSYEHPELFLLAIVPFLLLLLSRVRRRSGVLFSAFPLLTHGADQSAGVGVPRSLRIQLHRALPIVELGACVLFVIALAGPTERAELPRTRTGIDIVLCIDVSSSMLAKDLDPERTRLEVAKEAARRFVESRPDDRIALISFARYPDLICPLTLDHRALGQFLDELEIVDADGEEDLTGIGTAVAEALFSLRARPSRSRVVILLTDGEENVATSETPEEIGPLRAGLACRELGVRSYCILAGIGKKAEGGQLVPLDTRQMRRMAELTKGRYFEAKDGRAVDQVYETISKLEKRPFARKRYEVRALHTRFVLGGLLLLLLAVWLRRGPLELHA